MAFIRPLSNPEGLYVYHNVNGYISWNLKIVLPIRDFYMLARVCDKNWNKVGKWGKLELREVRIDSNDKILTEKEANKIYKSFSGKIFYKKALFFKNKLISLMWDVTWELLHNNVMKSLTHDKNNNKSRRKKKVKAKTK